MKLCIIQRILPHYRIRFFQILKKELQVLGIELVLIYGQERENTVPKTTELTADWAHRVDNIYFDIFGSELIWQPCLKYLKGVNLVIVEQSNRLLVNYWILLKYRKNMVVSFWGHGRNLQGNKYSFKEKFKKYINRYVDYWFAYTEYSKQILLQQNIDNNKITVVNNTIDVSELSDNAKKYNADSLNIIKDEVGIASNNVAIFCGGFSENKNIKFLIDACYEIKELVQDFEVILIGSGPDQKHVIDAAQNNKWIHYVGEKYGIDRVPYFLISKAMLLPGAVGLAVIDSFSLGVPMITVDNESHGPEASYLQDEVNSLITSRDLTCYAKTVSNYFRDVDLQNKLKSGCVLMARDITIENMVARYVAGVKSAINLV